MLNSSLLKLLSNEQLLAAVHTEQNSLTTTPLERELFDRLQAISKRPDAACIEGVACYLEEAVSSMPKEDFLQDAIHGAQWLIDPKRRRVAQAELKLEVQQLVMKLEDLQSEVARTLEYATSEIKQAQNLLTPFLGEGQ
jgi:hypothetical protein